MPRGRGKGKNPAKAGTSKADQTKKVGCAIRLRSSPAKKDVGNNDSKPSFTRIENIEIGTIPLPEDSMPPDARCPPPSPASRSVSPTKRRDVGGLAMPITKKLRFEGIEVIEGISTTSPETSPTASVANAFESLSVKHETLSHPLRDIDTIVPSLEEQWEHLMLFGGLQRTCTRISKHGKDEIIPISYSEECFVTLAKKIVRRYIASKYPDMPYADKYARSLNAKIELPSDLDLPNFIEACKAKSNCPITPLVNLLRPVLIEERLEAFRCLVKHPFYISRSSRGTTRYELLEDLIRWFHRRLTFNVGVIRGLLLPMNGALLGLGNDHIFDDEEEYNTGGYHDATLNARNEATWQLLIKNATQAEPMEIYNRFDELVGEFRWNNEPSDAGSSEVAPKRDKNDKEEEWNSDESVGSGYSSMPDLSDLFDEEKYHDVADARKKSDFEKGKFILAVNKIMESDE